MTERWYKRLAVLGKAHPKLRGRAPRRVMALALALCMALTALPVSAFGAEADGGLRAERVESTVLGVNEYAVVPAGDKLAVWYNDGGALMAVAHDGTLVTPETDPLPVFDMLSFSATSEGGSKFALNAIYTHSNQTGAAVVFGEALDWDTLAVSGMLSQKSSAVLKAGDWVFKGGLTNSDTYTVQLEGSSKGTLTVVGMVENTGSSAAVCLSKISAGSVIVAETGIVRGTSGFGMDIRGPATVLGRVETMGAYAVAVGAGDGDGSVLTVGGSASLQGAAASIFLENGTSVCAAADGTPYGGEPLTIVVNQSFAVGQPLVTGLTDENHAALFSPRFFDNQYSAFYDAAARVLRCQIDYYTVAYLDKTSDLAPPTDTVRYSSKVPYETAAVLTPSALTTTGRWGDFLSFRGWDTNQYGTGVRYQPGDTLLISDNTQLYAQWERTPYAVTRDEATSYYKTLTDAVEHTPEGGTVKLMSPVNSSEAALTLEDNKNYPHTLTLDLNGKSLDFGKNGVKVTAGYTFTLTGSGRITTSSYSPDNASEFLLWNDGGSLRVEGGDFAGYVTTLLHTGGTTRLTGGEFRGGTPSNAIQVKGTGAEETLLGLLGKDCFYAPGLVEKNADDTVASLVSLSARYPVYVLGPGAGSVSGTIENAPEGLTAQLLDPTGRRDAVYWPALRREGTGYAYTFSAPAGAYVLRLRNGAEQGLDYPVSVTAREKIVGRDFDFYDGRRLTAYDGLDFYLPGLTDLALAPELEDGQSVLVTAGRGGSADVSDVSEDAKAALARAAGQDASALSFYVPWIKTELRTVAGDTAVSFLTAPNAPIEMVDTSSFLKDPASYGYTLYRCAGPDNRVDRITTVPNAAGQGPGRSVTFFLGRLSAPDEPGAYALAKNPPPVSTASDGGYTLTASAGEGGRISPSGKVTVARRDSKTFTVTPDEGYEIADVLVDGKSVGPVASYRFEKVTAAHTIAAAFRRTPHPFTDVAEGAWYSGAVQFVYEHGLMNGTSDTAFAPDLDTTRGMIVAILWRLEGEPEAGGTSPFTDVPEDSYCADAAAWGAEAGVIEGYGNGNFGPNDPITREQMALTLYRCAGSPAATGTLDGFADADKAGGYAAEALKWAVAQGIITGKGGGILDPLGTATRAEAAAMLMRYLEKLPPA